MLLIPPSLSKYPLLLLISLSRVLDSTDSGEGLVSEAVWVVVGDTAAPVVGCDLLLGSTAAAADSASIETKRTISTINSNNTGIFK
jgi:hypothetical protein